MELSILYEDNHLLAINKPAGVLVQGDATGDRPLVEIGKDYIGKKYGKPGAVFLGVVHRLDRPVSGVVVFARTSKALERMNALFRNKQTQKTYWAVVSHRPPEESATLVHWLVKDEDKNKTKAYKSERAEGQRAELSYKVIGSKAGRFLVEVMPVTGRPHQIRVQLASIGCPIEGDLKYGAESPLGDASIALHGRQLGFVHPVKNEPMLIIANPPENSLWRAFASFFDTGVKISILNLPLTLI